MKLLDVAFTPQIFDPSLASSPQDWRDAIVELTTLLFGGREVLPLVVCNFQTDADRWEWEKLASVFVCEIKDHALRVRAEALLTQLRKVFVRRRPLTGVRSVMDERMWLGSIVESHGLMPFDGIVAQRSAAGAKDDPVMPLSMAAQVMGEHLAGVDSAACTAQSVADDIRVLFRYSDRIIMAMPYGSCMEFAVECLNRHLKPKQYSRVKTVDIHLMLGSGGSIEKYSQHWRSKLAKLRKDVAVTCHFWPPRDPPRERVIIGCEMSDIGDGADRMRVKPRWGLHLSHVPNEGDDTTKQPIERKLLHPRKADEHLKVLMSQVPGRTVVAVKL